MEPDEEAPLVRSRCPECGTEFTCLPEADGLNHQCEACGAEFRIQLPSQGWAGCLKMVLAIAFTVLALFGAYWLMKHGYGRRWIIR